MTTRKRITLATVASLPPNQTVWDTDIKGFCIRRQRSDVVSYLLKARVMGRIRWFTIGRHGQPWTPDTARRRAIQILASPTSGDKPTPVELTSVADALDQFLAIHGPKLKANTRYVYGCLIRTYLLPAFGKVPIATLTSAMISKAHASWNASPRSANHALSVLSKLMTWAEDQGLRPENSNPCQRVQRYRENNRERFLQLDELARLGEALDQALRENLASLYAIAALRLLIFTGARLSEILTLRWSYVDLPRSLLLLPDSKTGQKTIPLNAPAIEVLKSLPRMASNPFVIVGHIHGTHIVNLQKPWRRIRDLAGLGDVRIHDLRHTFASVAIASGGSLPIIGRALGHSQPSTTQRYAHLTDDPVRQLTHATGTALARALRAENSE